MSDSTSIFLIRHGQTEFNLEGRYQGQMDSPLTKTGRRQASSNGRLLANLIPDIEAYKIVASPLGRTMHTAKLICAELGVGAERIEPDGRLVEHGYGEWEGLLRDQIATERRSEWEAREADLWDYVIPGGESYRMVAERAKSWLDEVRSDKTPDKLIVISHGATGQVLRVLYTGIEPTTIRSLETPQDGFFLLEGGGVTRY